MQRTLHLPLSASRQSPQGIPCAPDRMSRAARAALPVQVLVKEGAPLDYGVCVWSGGNAPRPLVRQVAAAVDLQRDAAQVGGVLVVTGNPAHSKILRTCCCLFQVPCAARANTTKLVYGGTLHAAGTRRPLTPLPTTV